MTTKHTPATPLPWSAYKRDKAGNHVIPDNLMEKDSAYIVRACNSYPRLVEALQRIGSETSATQMEKIAALLRDLGEAE